MREMKDSGIEWIGEIPSSWKVSKVKYSYDVVLGKMLQPNQKKDTEELVPYMCAANITWSGVDLSTEKQMWFSESEKSLYLLKNGDLLVTEGGDVAVSCIWNNELPLCCIQNAVHRVRPKNDASNRYLFYWLYMLKSQGYIDLVCNKATLAHFTKEKLDRCFLVLPPSYEQKRIASYLDARCAEIDALIAAKEKTNALLRERRQSIIYEAVTKGLDPNAPMKDSGVEWIGAIPANWIPIRLKYVIKNIDSGTSVNAEDHPCGINEYGVLKTSCVFTGRFQPGQNKTVLTEEYSRLSCPVRKDSVIVSRMNTPTLVGACGYVENDHPNLFLPDRLWQVSFRLNCLSKYMWYFLSSEYTKAIYASICTGTSGSMQNISQEQFGDIILFLPSISEQASIVRTLDMDCEQIDSIIADNDICISQLKEYRQSLIYEAITGKTEV